MKNFADEIVEHIHAERDRFIATHAREPVALLIDPPDVRDIVVSDRFRYAPPMGGDGMAGVIASMFGIRHVAYHEHDLMPSGTFTALPDGSRGVRLPPLIDVRGYGNSLRLAHENQMKRLYPNTWKDHL